MRKNSVDPFDIIAKANSKNKDLIEETLQIVDLLKEKENREKAQEDFMHFVNSVWTSFIEGRHHKIMANAFERIAKGELKRLIINMPPRHTKSEFASYLFPAWFLGKYPEKKIIQTAHTAELATGFGRKVRNLFQDEIFTEIFPDVQLRSDSKAAGRWNTNKGGDYFSIGVGGAVTGKGADLLIIDDPHSEQEAQAGAYSPEVFDKVHEWYTSGPRQRLQPGGAICIVMTRWHKRDLTGKLIKNSIENIKSEGWELIEFPAIMPNDKPLWGEFWDINELQALRTDLPVSKWQAQYQQNPTSEEGAIIKREWWKKWDSDIPPPYEFVIQSWDTAFTRKERSDFSACTTWGVFINERNNNNYELILLDAFQDRYEFPDLKRVAFDYYHEWHPDAFIVEAKASGHSLIQELRVMGIPVSEFTPSRGNDKISRVNAVSDLFASGAIWCPETKWADEVVEQFAAFPSGDHDDLVDSCTQAILRFRQGGFVKLSSDEDDDGSFVPVQADYY
tara:strand:- start:739 stop:2253 length:1515 start_codon:yes stop_codon:yes gene_type:complete